MIIAIDFDGTIVEDKYPSIGKEKPFVIKDGHKLILWTVREGKTLNEAVSFCKERGVEFYAVNRDYPEEEKDWNKHYSRKLKVDLFIDDRNVGGLPDWGSIYEIISKKISYEELLETYNQYNEETIPRPKGLIQRLFNKK